MAHELPLLIHTKKSNHASQPSKPSNTKTNKHKPVKDAIDDRRLPNGAKADFGNGSSLNSNKKASKKTKHTSANSSNSNLPDAVLPDGSKPNFGNGKDTSTNGASGSSHKKQNKEPSLPNGEKPNFYSDGSKSSTKKKKSEQIQQSSDRPGNDKHSKKSNKSKDKKSAITEDTYAGSSFHSSPAALNLPKPSFKTSPKQSNEIQASSEPIYPPVNASSEHIYPPVNASSEHIYAPVNAPPQHPVTPYPIGNPGNNGPRFPTNPMMIPPGNNFVQPGFTYNVTPQGYINYQYPHAPPPPPLAGAFPMVATPYPPQLPPHHHLGPQHGQRISFNELLGSSKN